MLRLVSLLPSLKKVQPIFKMISCLLFGLNISFYKINKKNVYRSKNVFFNYFLSLGLHTLWY